MKNLFKLITTLLFLTVAAHAPAAVIDDNYIGSDDHGYGDRIGVSRYEVQNMDVSFASGFMTVRVNTNFSEAADPYGIQFGDLFISSNGWNPNGSAPYMSDNAATGEDWEFVFDTSAGSLFGGDFSINLSEDLINPAWTFRNGQEVQRRDGGTALSGSAVDLSHAGAGGYVEYNILLSSLGIASLDEIGLKWGMSCANDTIEGAVSVPEASSLSLLAIALLGLGVVARRKRD